jgi:hypothetical protein
MSDSKQLGDLTEETLRKLRADRVARAYTRITGKPCNCKQRKEKLNEIHRKWREHQWKIGNKSAAATQSIE